jgi:flagellar motility protein MotE (MotC chaperone)
VVEAAEKRLAERIAGLEAIEARISSLVDERKGQDDSQFSALVNMYENMKPADAADIFNELEMDVLLRVARAMNPRKMSPVMAKMATPKAQSLTLRLAEFEVEPSLDEPIDNLENLPQILGN